MESGGAVEGAARLLTVPFGAPATDALWATIGAAKGGDALAPVTVIVPGQPHWPCVAPRARGSRRRPVQRPLLRARPARRAARCGRARNARSHAPRRRREGRARPSGACEPAGAAHACRRRQRTPSSPSSRCSTSSRHRVPMPSTALRSFSRRGNALAGIATRFRSLAEASFYDEHDLALAAAGVIRDGSG